MKYRPIPLLRLLRRFLRSIELNGVRGAMARSYQRLSHSLKNHGLSGTFARAFVKAPSPPAVPQADVPQKPHPFDVLHGTDTGGHVSSGDLVGVSLSSLYATGYVGVPPSTLGPALATLPIKHEDFTFVDLGCGKGRALFIAGEFPFRRLVGVEIACDLAEVARANVAINPAWKERISITNQDAASFAFPEGPLVLFFYHPFFAPVLRRVVKNLAHRLRHSQCPAYLIHADCYGNVPDHKIFAENPGYRKIMESFPFITEVSDINYPLSAEDAAAEPSGCTSNRFTIFSADATG